MNRTGSTSAKNCNWKDTAKQIAKNWETKHIGNLLVADGHELEQPRRRIKGKRNRHQRRLRKIQAHYSFPLNHTRKTIPPCRGGWHINAILLFADEKEDKYIPMMKLRNKLCREYVIQRYCPACVLGYLCKDWAKFRNCLFLDATTYENFNLFLKRTYRKSILRNWLEEK